MIYHRLVVDRPLCDGNDLEHDGALRPRLLIVKNNTDDHTYTSPGLKTAENGKNIIDCGA